jgi:hypothetical protein
MSQNPTEPSEPTDFSSKSANRSANLGCLLLMMILGILCFSFVLGAYSTYRLHQHRAELIHQHLEAVIIPKLHLQDSPPVEALAQLKDLFLQQDKWFRGVAFHVYDAKDLKDARSYENPKEMPRLTLHGENISAVQILRIIEKEYDLTLEIIDGSINLLPKNETLEPRKTLSFKGISPDYWQAHPLVKAQATAEFWDIQAALEAEALPFPPRSLARYYPGQRRLEFQNLKANNEKITLWLQEKKLLP